MRSARRSSPMPIRSFGLPIPSWAMAVRRRPPGLPGPPPPSGVAHGTGCHPFEPLCTLSNICGCWATWSAQGHVWTAPWQELFGGCRYGRVRSRVRPVGAALMTAGPNASRRSSPNRKRALDSALTRKGFPIRGSAMSALRPLAPPNSFSRARQIRRLATLARDSARRAP